MKRRINTDTEKCVGCLACMTACIAAHHDCSEEGARSFRIIKKTKNQTGTFQKNVCLSCTHCGACISACTTGALYRDRETGLVLSDKRLCVGCQRCSLVCPQAVIFYDENGKIEKCDGCVNRIREGRTPACIQTCYLKAITMTTDI